MIRNRTNQGAILAPTRVVAALFACCALSLLQGCGGGQATVVGEVTLDGKPLEKGIITFASLEGEGGSARADIRNGRYEIKTTPGKKRVMLSAEVVTGKQKEHNGPGAPYVETVGESLPDRYHRKSDLTFEVRGGANSKDWSLTSKPR